VIDTFIEERDIKSQEKDDINKLDFDPSKSSATLEALLETPRIIELMEPLKKLGAGTFDHSIDVARMVAPVYQLLDERGLPHVPVEVAEKAALLHDIGKADIEDPSLIAAERPLEKHERAQVAEHPKLGAKRLREEDSVVADLIHSHHAIFPHEPHDAESWSAQVLEAIDIVQAAKDPKRKYRKIPLSDELVHEELKKKVPYLFEISGLVEGILQVGTAVLNTPVAQHATENV